MARAIKNDKADKFLDEMTDDQLKELYKEAETMAQDGYNWFKQFGENRKKGYKWEFKNPYWHIQYTAKEILGNRAIE
jgi:hypothetical protein